MISILKVNDKTAYNKKQFIVDMPEDIDNLPTDVGLHSMALCAYDGATYILTNDNGEICWRALGYGNQKQ